MNDMETPQTKPRMYPQGESTSESPNRLPESEGWVAPYVQQRLWWAARIVYQRRYLLIGLTLLAGVATAVLVLRMPNQYRAETRLLMPESGGGIGSLLDTVAPGASALLGKKGGTYTRYLAILNSRTMFHEVVDRFELERHYEVLDASSPREAAARELGERTTFEVSLDFDYLAVKVLDEDPQQAAQMANFLVERLNARHIEMSAGSAAENRRLLEKRVQEADVALDSAQASMQAFQERNGVVELEAQASALVEALGTAQGQVAQAEVSYQALLSQYGDENPDVIAAQAAVASARSSLDRLAGGGEAVMPVPMQRLPSLGRQYASIYQELRTQEEILKAVRPLYEQSVMTERMETSAVQVLDPAVAPARKAEPRRTVIVLSVVVAVATLLAFFLIVLAAWREQGQGILTRLRASES